jgi:hypothetical protein
MDVPPAARESDHRPRFWMISASGVRRRFYEVLGADRGLSCRLRCQFALLQRARAGERWS